MPSWLKATLSSYIAFSGGQATKTMPRSTYSGSMRMAGSWSIGMFCRPFPRKRHTPTACFEQKSRAYRRVAGRSQSGGVTIDERSMRSRFSPLTRPFWSGRLDRDGLRRTWRARCRRDPGANAVGDSTRPFRASPHLDSDTALVGKLAHRCLDRATERRHSAPA